MINDINNINDLVRLAYYCRDEFNDKIFLQYKVDDKFINITYREFVDLVEALSASLYNTVGIKKDDKIGIVSDNMYKWLITDMAILFLGAVDVPKGSDSPIQEVEYVLHHSEAKVCFVEDEKQADKVLSIIDKLPNLKTIVFLTGDVNKISSPNKDRVKYFYFDTLLSDGKKLKADFLPTLKEIQKDIDGSRLASIIYTSGTTGNPKGVMLLHKNFMQNVHSLPPLVKPVVGKERWMSVLPVWHVYERTLEYVIMGVGSSMAYSKPVSKHLLADFAYIKPTFMVSVPRIWESFYQAIIATINKGSPFSIAMFKTFIGIGKAYQLGVKLLINQDPRFKRRTLVKYILDKLAAFFIVVGLFLPDLIGDLLVFSKIRKKTGGKLVVPISGGGALPEYIDLFFAAIKVPLHEGYGLTETAPVVGVRNRSRRVFKTVGRPAPGVEVMIADDNWNRRQNQHRKGIIYIKGDLVMAGYYKEPEKTAAVLKDGWFNTGDLGRLTMEGDLQITGRAKDTIVLIGGENIEPAPIEAKLEESPYIAQSMIVGQDQKTLGALIVPSKEHLEEYAAEHKIEYTSYEELCKDSKILDKISKIVKEKISVWHGFKPYEKITNFRILSEPFKVGDEITLSLKMKRNYIAKKYAKLIEEMYVKNEE